MRLSFLIFLLNKTVMRIIHYIIVIMLALGIIASITTDDANAELRKVKTSEVCKYLTHIGLSTTNGWKKEGSRYACYSVIKEIGLSGPVWAPFLKNNLAYYAEGSAKAVDRLVLRVNVNNIEEEGGAHDELLRAIEILVRKSLNESLPANIYEVVYGGSSGGSTIDDVFLNVEHINWKTGRGYEIKFIIQ